MKVIYSIFFTFVSALMAPDMRIDGIAGTLCTVNVDDRDTVHDVAFKVSQKLKIPMSHMTLVDGTHHLQRHDHLRAGLDKLTLVVQKKPFAKITCIDVYKDDYAVEITDPDFKSLHDDPFAYMLRLCTKVRARFYETKERSIEVSLEELFQFLPNKHWEHPCCPRGWDNAERFMPFCRKPDTILRIQEALVVFDCDELTKEEQKLFCIVATNAGGFLQPASWKKHAAAIRGDRKSRIIVDIVDQIDQKISGDHPEIKQILLDYKYRTGDFQTDEHGNIPSVNPAITIFMDEFVRTLDVPEPSESHK